VPGGAWWRRRSLRARLTVAAGVVIAVGMAAAAVLLTWRLHAMLLSNLDDTLTQRVAAVAAETGDAELPGTLPGSGAESVAVQVVGPSGRVLAASANVVGEPRLFRVPPGHGDPTVATVESASLAADYRVAALAVPTPTGPVTVYAGAPTTEVSASTAELDAALLVGVPIVVALLCLVGWWLLGRALRPVEELRRQAAAIPGTDLHRRLDTSPAGDELGRLRETFNELLGRIEAGTERQRTFVADAAHELRSPLAALRTRLEIQSRTTGACRSEDPVLADVVRLSEMADGLLALARLDANPELPRRAVDLDDLVWQEVAAARGQGPPAIETAGISAARITGDPASLRRVVANLLSNARRHARSSVSVELRTDGASALLTVADDGPGIPAEAREHVFERFARLDEARSRDQGGAGLGLAIVADIVAAHGGAVWISDNHPGARLHVRLPGAEA
jgi:signal transduction histidine kinase